MTARDEQRPTVLLADDDDGVRFTLGEVLAEADVEVIEVADGQEALSVVERPEQAIDLLITDLKMPKVDGMELLQRARELRPGLRVVMITAHGSEAHAVRAMKLGAYDYFSKPFDVDDVVAVIRRATETVRLGRENRRLRAELALARHMVFRSRPMSRVALLVDRVAARDVTVLITGESGTGKELVANALVAASARADRAFLKFNCAAVPRELAEAELFGHTKGAFTGATHDRPGLFKQADGGTLFLDEVAELDPVVQGKLLRVLQEGEVKPVGQDRPQKVDVRIIAATHRDPQREVEAGRFREDLFYRLHVVVIPIPPLRERPEDLDPLIDHFLVKHADRFGLPACRLAPGARARLLAREYRGNVRELENTVERLVALSSGGLIEDPIEDLLEGGEVDAAADMADIEAAAGLRARVEAFERRLIVEELQRCGQNRSEAARRLKIGRVTLLDKIKKYGL
jgi:two-component system response regulator HydG